MYKPNKKRTRPSLLLVKSMFRILARAQNLRQGIFIKPVLEPRVYEWG